MLSNNALSKIHEDLIADFFRPKPAADLITAEIVVRILFACYSITGNGANHSIGYTGFKNFINTNEFVDIDASVGILEQLGVVILGHEEGEAPVTTIRFSNEFFAAYRRAKLPTITAQCVVYDKYYRVLDELIKAYPMTPWPELTRELMEIKSQYALVAQQMAKTESDIGTHNKAYTEIVEQQSPSVDPGTVTAEQVGAYSVTEPATLKLGRVVLEIHRTNKGIEIDFPNNAIAVACTLAHYPVRPHEIADIYDSIVLELKQKDISIDCKEPMDYADILIVARSKSNRHIVHGNYAIEFIRNINDLRSCVAPEKPSTPGPIRMMLGPIIVTADLLRPTYEDVKAALENWPNVRKVTLGLHPRNPVSRAECEQFVKDFKYAKGLFKK